MALEVKLKPVKKLLAKGRTAGQDNLFLHWYSFNEVMRMQSILSALSGNGGAVYYKHEMIT
jgi:hypothetical protein